MIEYKEGVFLFVSGKYLTTNSDGTPSAPLTVDEMLAMYDDFSKCTEATVSVKEKAVCFNAPNASGTAAATLSAGTQVTILAKDKTNTWYYIKTSDGKYYFAGVSCFTEGTVVG